MEVELLVKLVVPDATANTAMRCLQQMGFALPSLVRQDYYSFTIAEGASFDTFAKKIQRVDVLANANKHRSWVKQKQDVFEGDKTNIIVEETNQNNEGMVALLHRLGVSEVISMTKGTLWTFPAEKQQAIKMTEALLMNKHYQNYRVLG